MAISVQAEGERGKLGERGGDALFILVIYKLR